MKLVLATLSLFCVLGLSKLQAGSAASPAVASASLAVASSEPEAAAVGAEEAEAYCPMQWSCNFRSWYTTEAACRASCSTPDRCMLEYRCTAGCVCP